MCRLKVERGHIVEHDAYLSAQQTSRVFHAYLLDALTKNLVQLVHETVYRVHLNINTSRAAQIIYCCQLTAGLADAGHDKIAEHIALKLVEPDIVIDSVE